VGRWRRNLGGFKREGLGGTVGGILNDPVPAGDRHRVVKKPPSCNAKKKREGGKTWKTASQMAEENSPPLF